MVIGVGCTEPPDLAIGKSQVGAGSKRRFHVTRRFDGGGSWQVADPTIGGRQAGPRSEGYRAVGAGLGRAGRMNAGATVVLRTEMRLNRR